MKQRNFNLWIRGARLRTLGAAIVPVFVGGGIALDSSSYGALSWGRFGLALTVALSIQIAVNFANDYSDGRRGVDSTEVRKGPIRLVGSGLKSPRAVLIAALIFFFIAMVAGFFLAALAGYQLLIVGAVALFAAWTYTGGPWPYGYKALGEVSVFIFFGLIATVGTTYSLINELPVVSWLAGAGVGALSSAILIGNNFRDIKGDEVMGKKTLAVALGAKWTQILYLAMFFIAGALVVAQMFFRVWTGFALLGLLLGFLLGKSINKQTFLPQLGRAVVSLYGYGIALSLAYWL